MEGKYACSTCSAGLVRKVAAFSSTPFSSEVATPDVPHWFEARTGRFADGTGGVNLNLATFQPELADMLRKTTEEKREALWNQLCCTSRALEPITTLLFDYNEVVSSQEYQLSDLWQFSAKNGQLIRPAPGLDDLMARVTLAHEASAELSRAINHFLLLSENGVTPPIRATFSQEHG